MMEKKRIIIAILIVFMFISWHIVVLADTISKDDDTLVYSSKTELFNAFYKDFYLYLQNIPEAKEKLEKEGINNLNKFYELNLIWDNTIKGMEKAGIYTNKYYIAPSKYNTIESQRGRNSFIGYCLENDMYIDFINFLAEFFKYFRIGEGLLEEYGEQITNFYFNPLDSAIDTAKFFYFSKNTLPAYINTKPILVDMYENIPLYKKNIENNTCNVDDDTYIKIVKDFVDLKENPNACHFPTLLTQNYYVPNKNDIFGIDDDTIPIYKVDIDLEKKNYKKLALTFDGSDIAKASNVYEILDILDSYNIKATFFMEYNFLKNNEPVISEIAARGHEIGNHSTNHISFDILTDEEIINEVMINHNFVKRLTGIDMCLFRFPYGKYNNRAIELVKKLGYYPIQWMLDSEDWKNEPEEKVYERLINSGKIYSGTIILFHVWPENTKSVLSKFLEYLNENNFSCMKVSDLIYKHNFEILSGRQREKRGKEW